MAMTVGRRQYNEGDMLRMQRDAEERVRSMQNQARRTVEDANSSTHSSNRNRNWSSNSGMNRPRNNRNQNGQPQQQKQHTPEPEPEEIETPVPPEEAPMEAKKESTVIGDIMGALKLDEDYLLIVGLLLILINQRADTTLILALAYLLI